MDRTYRTTRSGVALIYILVSMTVLIGLCSLAVDWGRVQVAKNQLQTAADAAARAGAAELANSVSRARSSAMFFARSNNVDGASIVVDPAADIQFGTWNANNRTFTVRTGWDESSSTAVRVRFQRSAARGNPIPLLFASVLGQTGCDVRAQATALYYGGVNINQLIPGIANPFLAGMPPGSVASLNNPHRSPDYAGTASNPRQSPFSIGMPIIPGSSLNFDSISGTVGHDPNLASYQPDGQLDDIGHNTNGSENGISDIVCPINALVGVFLDDRQPNTTSAPSRLNFSTAASRNFTTLSPRLKQIFFIGDGENSDGRSQQFIVPAGATRLYLATWDFYEWNNNYGNRTVKIVRPPSVTTVD